jgi:HEXXH motif-containing protein
MKVSFHQLWRDVTPFGAEEEARLKTELRLLLRALTVAEQYLPNCIAWVRSRTQVIIPLRKLSGEHSSSSSASNLPGVVFLTLHNELQAIEALVHEGAHQHLFVAEATSALVDPRHTSVYKSPLRDDPRPLRGVLLACHALAYIAAFYTDALNASMAAADRLEARIGATRQKLTDALDILLANRRHLTVHGCDFVDRTVKVERYSA